jgi:hypothetical protein
VDLRGHFVRPNPRLQAVPIENAGRDFKYRVFGRSYRRLEPTAIEPKKRDHGCVPDPLVAVDERMILDEGETERGGLARHIAIEVLAAERLPWLGDSCLQGAEITARSLPITRRWRAAPQPGVPHYFRRSWAPVFRRRSRQLQELVIRTRKVRTAVPPGPQETPSTGRPRT